MVAKGANPQSAGRRTRSTTAREREAPDKSDEAGNKRVRFSKDTLDSDGSPAVHGGHRKLKTRENRKDATVDQHVQASGQAAVATGFDPEDPTAAESTPGFEWGQLISPFAQNPSSLKLTGNQFVIGAARRCNWQIPTGAAVPSMLCRVLPRKKPVKDSKYASSAVMECLSNRVSVSVNSHVLKKGEQVALHGGSEINIAAGSAASYAFIFVPSDDVDSSKEKPSLEPGVPDTADRDTEKATGATSEVIVGRNTEEKMAACEDAASEQVVLHTTTTTTAVPEPPPSVQRAIREAATTPVFSHSVDEETLLGRIRSVTVEPTVEATTGKCQPTEPEGGSDEDMQTALHTATEEKDAAVLGTTAALQASAWIDDGGSERCVVDEELPSHEPALRKVAMTSQAGVNIDSSGEEEGEELLSAKLSGVGRGVEDPMLVDPASGSGEEQTLEHFRAVLLKDVKRPADVLTTFDTLGYYLGDGARQQLQHTAFLHLSAHGQLRNLGSSVLELPNMSSRVLLSGPSGSDMYLEAVVQALAKEHGASLLVYDRVVLGLDSEELGSSTAPAGSYLDKHPGTFGALKKLRDSGQSLGLTLKMRKEDVASALRDESDSPRHPDGDKGLSKIAVARAIMRAKVSGIRDARREASQSNKLKKGDRVRFAGGTGFSGASGASPASLSSALSLLGRPRSQWPRPATLEPSQANTDRSRTTGPLFNYRGQVVLAFDSQPDKVGVKFDYVVPGGTSLGGLCKDGRGYWCEVADLRLEGCGRSEEAETAAINALFETASDLAAEAPVIVFVKHIEEAMLANAERFMRFRGWVSKLPSQVLLVGQHTSPESRRDRPYGGIFARMGGSPSPMGGVFDLSFLDSFRPGEADLAKPQANRLDQPRLAKMVQKLLPNSIVLHAPQDEPAASEWKKAIARDALLMREQTNRLALQRAASRCGVTVETEDVSLSDHVLSTESVERVLGWAFSAELRKASKGSTDATGSGDGEDEDVPNAATGSEQPKTDADVVKPLQAEGSKPKFVIGSESISCGLELLKTVQGEGSSSAIGKDSAKNLLKSVQTDNEFEKKLLAEVVPADEVGVSFDDIGALETVKTTLREVVMLPLQRPELFARGSLTKPTRGVLLFGPPGTGKTMMAKAVASESGANFINVSMAALASKWFGEGEKYVKALFTLAHKIAPSVVFVDEVDSMLGRRDKSGEHEAMRKIKNEFMANWDGLKTKETDRVLVLAATNRPFDLDEAVIRRMPRRLMVDLPDTANRTKILSVILKDEELEDGFQHETLAAQTEGYTGSDLRNLCVAAAYRPIRDFLEAERKAAEASGGSAQSSTAAAKDKMDGTPDIKLRSLTLDDFLKAQESICPSVSSDAKSMTELREWNELYGEGGSRKKDTLTYFM